MTRRLILTTLNVPEYDGDEKLFKNTQNYTRPVNTLSIMGL